MKYGDGTTPIPNSNPYSEAVRQEILDGLKNRYADEKARVDERKEKYDNITLPLVDTTTEANREARRIAYNQNNKTRTVFQQYQQYQQKLKDLQYQKQRKMEDAMAQYQSVDMRAQRDKAGAEAGATFDDQIAQMQGLMTSSMELHSDYQIKSDLANKNSISTRFDNISAFNDAISDGFSIANDYMDLGDLQRQIGFFEGMA